MSKYYVRTNEGAYLKSHAEFTHYWTKKRDDAEQLTMLEAMKVMDHNKEKLKKGVELYIEPIDDEELKAELKQDRLLNLLLGEDNTGGKTPDTNVDEVNHPSGN